jgi:hypothetical protein
MRSTLSREMMRAREAFDRLGRIPYDIAAALMALGIMVPALEDQWARAQN